MASLYGTLAVPSTIALASAVIAAVFYLYGIVDVAVYGGSYSHTRLLLEAYDLLTLP